MRCDRGIARLGREDKARRDGKAMGAARMCGEILAEVERLRPWFHCIDLGEGMKTKTESVADEPVDHPWGTWQTIRKYLPEDLLGKSVLDVGCNAGFYAVEAKRQGDIAPGEVAYLGIRLQAPERPGMYYVEFDMLAEQFAWFEDL